MTTSTIALGTTRVLILSSTHIFIQDERRNEETSINGEETYSIDTNIKDDATNDRCLLAIQLLSNRIDADIIGTSVFIRLSKRTNSNNGCVLAIQLLSNRTTRRERNNKFDTVRNKEKSNVRHISCTSTKHSGRPDFVTSTPEECELIIILSICLSIRIESRHKEEELQKVIFVSLIDGECALIILLSKVYYNDGTAVILLPKRNSILLLESDNENCKYNDGNTSALTLLLKENIESDNEIGINDKASVPIQQSSCININHICDNNINDTEKCIDYVLILLSKLLTCNHTVRNEDSWDNCNVLVLYNNCFLRHNTSIINTSVFIPLSNVYQ